MSTVGESCDNLVFGRFTETNTCLEIAGCFKLSHGNAVFQTPLFHLLLSGNDTRKHRNAAKRAFGAYPLAECAMGPIGGLFQTDQRRSGDFAILLGRSAADANRADNPAVDDNRRAAFDGNHTRQA